MSTSTAHIFDDLDSWLTYLEGAHPVGIDMGLHRITQVKKQLGLQFACPVITVAGTNGKGSTCAFLESIFQSAGYRVGCHTSPHFLKFNERARLLSEPASDQLLLDHFKVVEEARVACGDGLTLTYFEFTTLAIMHLFAQSNLDVVILEVGLGGRLDAVNIIDADCAIVTSIDIDHQAYLGNTRDEIALQKAGIFRSGRPAICSDPVPPQSLLDYAVELGADLWVQGRDFNVQGDQQQWAWAGRGKRYSGLGYPALRGANQLLNASGVLAALTSLRNLLPVSAQDIRNGFALVDLPGRFQVLPGKPTILMDVAHNPHACAALAQGIDKMGYFPYTYAVFGAMADKDIAGLIKPLLNSVDYWYCTDLPLQRAAKASNLANILRELGVKDGPDSGILEFPDPAKAYQETLKRVTENDRIAVFGSFYTVAGVMDFRKNQAH